MSKVLLSFDIDGTLLNCLGGRKVQRQSFMYAFNKFFNKSVNEKDLWGKLWVGITDGAVAKGILEKHNKTATPKDVEKFLNFYNERYISLCDCLKPQLTPGIREAIEEVKQMDDVVISVATGNTKPTAELKLDVSGLKDLFKPLLGGFGNNMYRYQCIKEAKRYSEQVTGYKFKGSIHIGDTDDDVSSALKAGSFPVGVMTSVNMQRYTPGAKYFIRNLKDDKDYLLEQIERIKKM